MRAKWLTVLAGSVVTLAACAQRQVEVATGDVGRTGAAATARSWRATLTPPPGVDTVGAPAPGALVGGRNVGGTVHLQPAESARERTSVRVMLTGAVPGSSHPWHVHLGTCGNDEGILGPTTAYTPVEIGQDGQGQVTVVLPVATPSSGRFYVSVHESRTAMEKVIACGNLSTGM